MIEEDIECTGRPEPSRAEPSRADIAQSSVIFLFREKRSVCVDGK